MPVSNRLEPFGTTIFTEMTRLALEHNAINLSQGFPDFDGPEFVKAAAVGAIRAGHNQYARMLGLPALNRAIAEAWKRSGGVELDPDSQVQVTSGCTAAIPAAMLGLINPGAKVVLFEPYYDSYRACVSMAGGEAVFVALRPPPEGSPAGAPFTFDGEELEGAFRAGARFLVLNTPHNPTGKVFSREELSLIAEMCVRYDAVAITDEVYERLTFDAALPHLRLATFPGMAERTVTLSSLGKTFSLTGWKVGWAVASAELIRGVRAAHQFLSFATATPMQHGAVKALSEGELYVRTLVEQYREGRDYLCNALAGLGFRVFVPAGTYFIMADHSAFGYEDDFAFCRALTKEVGVAAIPPSVFYARPELGRRLVRFAFCKKRETLEQAVGRLKELKRK